MGGRDRQGCRHHPRRRGRSSDAAGRGQMTMVVDPFIFRLAIFILAIFVGYYVVWSVTPALHTPLMSVTNAISSVIIVGALIAAGPEGADLAKIFGFVAITLAAINIFGGFVVTQRMLSMYKKKKK
ncbi:NAD(P) transhydrogenase subunit alpha [Oceanibacterium hippocampi]